MVPTPAARNAIKHAMIMHDAEEMRPDMIPVTIRRTNSLATTPRNSRQLVIDIPDDGVTFEKVERRVIEHTLKLTEWNKNRAARMLKMSGPVCSEKLRNTNSNRNPKEVSVAD